jgi:hypothetical protein
MEFINLIFLEKKDINFVYIILLQIILVNCLTQKIRFHFKGLYLNSHKFKRLFISMKEMAIVKLTKKFMFTLKFIHTVLIVEASFCQQHRFPQDSIWKKNKNISMHRQ